ncbi:MAG TPA: hypothetical protein VI522_02295 [Gammaproteobacteria bacterium]|nr:hypothetical protein [Gammaproteobacteria bacterium]
MTAAQLKQLKQMAQEVVDLMPDHLTVNGSGRLFESGDPINTVTVLAFIENARETAEQLNAVIQKLEGRKAAKK